MRKFKGVAHFLLVMLLACNTTKSSFNNSFKNYKIVVYESRVVYNQPEFLVHIRDQHNPLTQVAAKDFFIYEDNFYPSLKTEMVNLSPPATLYLTLLIDVNAENASYLSLAKWVINKALQRFTLPLKVRLFSYEETFQELTSGFSDKIDKVLDLLEQLETTTHSGNNKTVLKNFFQEFNDENHQYINLSLDGEKMLSNSVLLIASKANNLEFMRKLHNQNNIILLSYQNKDKLDTQKQTLDPYKRLFINYPLNEDTLVPLTQEVLAKQLEELVGGYYKLSYLSRFTSGVHDASFAFESHPESGTKVAFDFSKHMYYHLDATANLQQITQNQQHQMASDKKEMNPAELTSSQITEPKENSLPEKEIYQELVVTSLGDNWKAESPVEKKLEDEWWYVQVGAFKQEEGCYSFLDPLTQTHQTSILKARIEGQSLYRCLVGPVEQERMATLKELLTFKGYKGVFGLHSDQLVAKN